MQKVYVVFSPHGDSIIAIYSDEFLADDYVIQYNLHKAHLWEKIYYEEFEVVGDGKCS